MEDRAPGIGGRRRQDRYVVKPMSFDGDSNVLIFPN